MRFPPLRPEGGRAGRLSPFPSRWMQPSPSRGFSNERISYIAADGQAPPGFSLVVKKVDFALEMRFPVSPETPRVQSRRSCPA
jgi:hypothetical protein